jgi:SAM-dependent methyltransferase
VTLHSKVKEGHYAKKQIFSKAWLIAWNHRRRFETGLGILRDLHPTRLLDYGSGDGTFLAILAEQPWHPELSVGAELVTDVLKDCRLRFADLKGVEFCFISELAQEKHRAAYDTVVCMEVLEHVSDLEGTIDQLHSVLAPDGHIVISVPVEIGPPVLVKQMLRRIAGWRNIGDYKYNSRYSLLEMWKSLFAGAHPHIARPVYRTPEGAPFHDHKGFNWRYLEQLLKKRFILEKRLASPFHFLGPLWASQVWFVGKKLTTS